MFGAKREKVTSGWRKLYSHKISKSSKKLQDGQIPKKEGAGRVETLDRKERINVYGRKT